MQMRLRQAYSAPPGFTVEAEAVDWDGTLVVASGEMDIAAVPALRGLLDEAIAAGETRMVVDLTDVDFVDSVALATLVGAKRRLGPDGCLALVVTHPYVLLVLQATGLDHVVCLTGSREAAVAEVTRT